MSGVKRLFLDIDGVLNHHGTKERIDGMLGIDPGNVAPLNRICERVPELRIVLSSTWRMFFTNCTMREFLHEAGFEYPERLTGQTPSYFSATTRGREIQRWLDEFGWGVDGIAILDDSEDMAHLAPWLVRTDWLVGLTDEHIDQVLERLGRQPPARRAP